MRGPAVNGQLRAAVLVFRCGGASVRSFSCSSESSEHVRFIREVAKAEPPEHLVQLLRMFKARGDNIVPPGAKQGLLPLAIPLAKNSSGALTALLRWPTAPPGMEMPVVEVWKHGAMFLAKNVDQFIHRLLVEGDEDQESSDELFEAAADAGEKLYKKGDFARSKLSETDVYLLKKVGLFPDVLERKIMRHIENGDNISALVATEFYTKRGNFPGFARPFVFNAKVLLRLGRCLEAKDAARGALKLPWWTLSCRYEEVAKIADWENEQIEYHKERVTEEGKQRDLERGKPPGQVALDEAAFLLDLASIQGTWDESVERIAKCCQTAGLSDIARFMLYRD